MKVKLIVAKGKNNVIGKDNDLIWHLPADMRFFTQSTKGHIVVMGRKNWDSIPLKYRPLSDRINAVVTRNKDFNHEDCIVFHSIEEAIEFYRKDASSSKKDLFIIGGGQIYDYSIKNNLIDEMLITYIDAAFEGDTFFPDFDESLWRREEIMDHPVDEKNEYPFKVYRFSPKNP
ncbi:MAG: dihydrofolate reductase [Crocinitomicaceae bacterium]